MIIVRKRKQSRRVALKCSTLSPEFNLRIRTWPQLVAAALALIEPAILIVMGVVVVFILISLSTSPIFSLGQSTGIVTCS